MSEQSTGKVYLVGAGPGDVGLISKRAMRCLAEAQVVVYDHLANPALLTSCAEQAELIYVGKMAGDHTLSQREIEELLIARAREGKVVVRLKGGDPFVFGRGGEEALALAEAGIAFEVIPGITSAIAVPAYAGIPVTHRGIAASFHVFTAHEAPEKNHNDLDWKTIAQLEGTLIFLMGVRTLHQLVTQLVRHGKSPQTPAAVIRWGTMPEQEVVTGTLGDIVQRANEAHLEPPAITIIGEVVRLRPQLRWIEHKPLFGYRIALTRPKDQSEELAELLQREGADVLLTPTIAIKPRAFSNEIRDELLKLHSYDWIVFTSANGVKFFFNHLRQLKLDARALSEAQVAAIGEKTAETLEAHGVRPDAVPGRFVQEALAESLKVHQNDHVLVPRAAVARDALERILTEKGAHVRILPLYDTVPDERGISQLRDALREKRVHIVTFTSASTVESLAASIEPEELAALFPGVLIASIGPLTSAALCKLGLQPAVEAKIHTAAHLARSIMEYLENQSQQFHA
ncbi:MAG: uroporphyrinogen-III C-methyltransferase [Candidatus Sumerlaeaceae bacterium]